MKLSDAIKAIQEITAANGYPHFPTDVSDKPSERSQSVLVESGRSGKVKLTINAEGRTLSRIKDHIVEKIGDAAVFTDETSTLKEPEDGNDPTS